MSAKNIVARTREVGLDMIAITDHNMVENSFYVDKLAGGKGPVVLFGMELQTVEEVHLLVLFGDYATAIQLQELVYDRLPAVENDPEYFGDQVVVDGDDNIIRFEERLLLNSSNISVNQAFWWAKEHGGLVIPSHIDSPTFSIISQLGYVPDDIRFDALEIANPEKLPEVGPFIMCKDIPIVSFSDAHYLKDIGKKKLSLQMEEPTFAEVAKALKVLGVHGGQPGPSRC
jgi:predicted metal-dependent phosphoesterase TrpH